MPLVSPLDDIWRDAIDSVLHTHGWPSLADSEKLGPLVARLSESYNQSGVAARDLLPARLAFSFARDVPKGAGAVRELVGTGRLTLPGDRPLRVLDLGAGLGATTWGVARALEAAGARGAIEATWVDADAAALGVGLELLRARGQGAITVRARTMAGTVTAVPRGEAWDLVLLGQVLSELDTSLLSDARIERHASLVRGLLASAVRPDGALVVIEPALRERTRHLHAVRDAVLAASSDAKVSVFAPCLHAGACPALALEGDWCHEDLPVDLPDWLAPVARAAGLRWQGLTFSYLVLRRDGATLRVRGFPWRVISGPIVTKGKRELFLCGAEGGPPARVRVQRLDRHASTLNAAWDTVARGACIRVREPEAGGGLGRPASASAVAKIRLDTAVDVDGTKE